MRWPSRSFIGRNLLGLTAMLLAHNILDPHYFGKSLRLADWTPYLFLVLLYGWIVFHNRFLFERLFLGGNRSAYVGWLLLFLAVGTVNLHLVLRNWFNVANTTSFIMRYYSDVVTGLAVYVAYRYLTAKRAYPSPEVPKPIRHAEAEIVQPDYLTYLSNGTLQTIPMADIVFVEGLENYIKVVTAHKTHVVRMTLKETEARLQKHQFVRISKSHIVNVNSARRSGPDNVLIADRTLRIGRVFKRYASEKLPEPN